MPIKGVKICGARCRTKGGEPCLGPAMPNGRCRMHNGKGSRLIHGGLTILAKAQRKKEHQFLKEMKDIARELNEVSSHD